MNTLDIEEDVIRMEEERRGIGRHSTVVELLEAAEDKIEAERMASGHGQAGRELALSITHLEDAKMRYVRGRCIQRGNFDPSYDPDR